MYKLCLTFSQYNHICAFQEPKEMNKRESLGIEKTPRNHNSPLKLTKTMTPMSELTCWDYSIESRMILLK